MWIFCKFKWEYRPFIPFSRQKCNIIKKITSILTAWIESSIQDNTTSFRLQRRYFGMFRKYTAGNPKVCNSETLTLAAALFNWCKKSTVLFWLTFYSKIMPYIDILFNKLQVLQTNPVRIHAAIDDFEKTIIEIRNKLLCVSVDKRKVLGCSQEQLIW